MHTALEHLSKTQLIGLLAAEQKAARTYQKRLARAEQDERYLKAQIAHLKRMLFGQKRERFEAPGQTALPFEAGPEQQAQQQQALSKTITYTRNKQSRAITRGGCPCRTTCRSRWLRSIRKETCPGWSALAPR